MQFQPIDRLDSRVQQRKVPERLSRRTPVQETFLRTTVEPRPGSQRRTVVRGGPGVPESGPTRRDRLACHVQRDRHGEAQLPAKRRRPHQDDTARPMLDLRPFRRSRVGEEAQAALVSGDLAQHHDPGIRVASVIRGRQDGRAPGMQGIARAGLQFSPDGRFDVAKRSKRSRRGSAARRPRSRGGTGAARRLGGPLVHPLHFGSSTLSTTWMTPLD